MSKRLTWSSAAYSHVGKVRKLNEDACLERAHLGDGGLWAVADGMGGHEAGEVASQMIVEFLRQVPAPVTLDDFIDATEAALYDVNRNIKEKSATQYDKRTIGSTVVVFIAYQGNGVCLWVGDSRIYRLRSGQLEQLTRDHSHVQELVDRGLIDSADAESHPMANVITRAVGSAQEVRIDQLKLELQAGDVYLLCSDGLNKTVSEPEIASLMNQPDSQLIVETLIRKALERGASDNVTTVVIKIYDDSNDDTVQIEDSDITRPIEQLNL